jgi:BlaI family penicillinase repressor
MAKGVPRLSRREREIMDIVYALGEATARDIRTAMTQAPTDAAVRATLRILVDKGHLSIHQDGIRYLYRPRVARDAARRSQLQHVIRTFFDGSAESAMAALVDLQRDTLDDAARKRLKKLIDDAAKREGRS